MSVLDRIYMMANLEMPDRNHIPVTAGRGDQNTLPDPPHHSRQSKPDAVRFHRRVFPENYIKIPNSK